MTDRIARVWYCGIAGRRTGPMSLEELQGMVDRGELIGSDLVWCPDFGETWRAAESVDGLDFSRQPQDSRRTASGQPYPPPEPEEPIIMPSTPLTGVEGEQPSAREAGRRAWKRMKAILFRPFSFARWCGIALTAWLASIGTDSVNIRVNPGDLKEEFTNFFKNFNSDAIATITNDFMKSLESIPHASGIVIASIAMGILFSIALSVVLCWIRARATFALLHKIHRPDATWSEAWQVGQAGGIAKSLFLWRLCLGIASGVLCAPIAIVTFLYIVKATKSASGNILAIGPIFLIVSSLIAIIAVTYSLVMSLTVHFMEPVMYWRQVGARQAWKVMNEFCSQNAGAVFRYYVMLVALMFVGFFAIIGITICSLLTYLLLLMIPFVGSLALLPITVFFRSTGLEMLRQWRPDLAPEKLDKVAEAIERD